MNPVQLAVPSGRPGPGRAVYYAEVFTRDHGDRVGKRIADVHIVDNDVPGIPALYSISGQPGGHVPAEGAAALVSGQVRNGHIGGAGRRDNGITARWPLRRHKARSRLDNCSGPDASQRYIAPENKMAADQEGTGGQGHDAAAPPGGGVDGVLD